MSEPEDFLSRWSRRKREVAQEESLPAHAATPRDVDPKIADPKIAVAETGTDDKPAFDVSTLPSLDSIGPGTDIQIFMQQGVPTALSRAALRRAWSADPAIRDFIGLSENAWDFTVPNEITGFGELDPAEAARLLASAFGDPTPNEEISADSAMAQTGKNTEQTTQLIGGTTPDSGALAESNGLNTAPVSTPKEMLWRENSHAALQQGDGDDDELYAEKSHTHGSALPK